MNNPVQAVLEEGFPDREVAEAIEKPESGHQGNRTLRVRFADGKSVFLKIRVDGDAERNEREAATTRYARTHCAVRVPSVVTADSTFSPPYLATAPLEGAPANEDWEMGGRREAIARDVGRAVAGISAARFDDHGWITGGNGEHLDCESAGWSEVLADAIERKATQVQYPDRFNDVPGRVGDLLRDNSDVLAGATAALVHHDTRPENVYRNERPGVIDWEWTLVGDPGLGLCWGEEWVADRADVSEGNRECLRDAVRNGYRGHAGELPRGLDRRRPFYRVVTFLPKLQTFDLWVSDAPEPTQDLADWVRSELDDRIAAVEAIE